MHLFLSLMFGYWIVLTLSVLLIVHSYGAFFFLYKFSYTPNLRQSYKETLYYLKTINTHTHTHKINKKSDLPTVHFDINIKFPKNQIRFIFSFLVGAFSALEQDELPLNFSLKSNYILHL
ncbi:unnamed protein product [Prunus armeniaca]